MHCMWNQNQKVATAPMSLAVFWWATVGMKSRSILCIAEYSSRIVCNMFGHTAMEADPTCVVPSV